MRAQAAELRQLKDAGLLGAPRSAAAPRPVGYATRDEDGETEFRPFPAAFKPLLGQPGLPPPLAAAAAKAQRGSRPATAAAAAAAGAEAGGPLPALAGAAVA